MLCSCIYKVATFYNASDNLQNADIREAYNSITVEKSICCMYGENYLLPYDNFHKTGIKAYETGFAMKRLFHILTY